jgi:hypothetical protein
MHSDPATWCRNCKHDKESHEHVEPAKWHQRGYYALIDYTVCQVEGCKCKDYFPMIVH